jgi:hypothetical protein
LAISLDSSSGRRTKVRVNFRPVRNGLPWGDLLARHLGLGNQSRHVPIPLCLYGQSKNPPDLMICLTCGRNNNNTIVNGIPSTSRNPCSSNLFPITPLRTNNMPLTHSRLPQAVENHTFPHYDIANPFAQKEIPKAAATPTRKSILELTSYNIYQNSPGEINQLSCSDARDNLRRECIYPLDPQGQIHRVAASFVTKRLMITAILFVLTSRLNVANYSSLTSTCTKR